MALGLMRVTDTGAFWLINSRRSELVKPFTACLDAA